jgi:hypothetical protein
MGTWFIPQLRKFNFKSGIVVQRWPLPLLVSCPFIRGRDTALSLSALVYLPINHVPAEITSALWRPFALFTPPRLWKVEEVFCATLRENCWAGFSNSSSVQCQPTCHWTWRCDLLRSFPSSVTINLISYIDSLHLSRPCSKLVTYL